MQESRPINESNASNNLPEKPKEEPKEIDWAASAINADEEQRGRFNFSPEEINKLQILTGKKKRKKY